MQKFKFPVTLLLVAGLLTLAFLGCQKSNEDPLLTSNAKPTPTTKLQTPSISCSISSSISIDLTITAGATTGAPAGFSVQWMTAAALAANNNIWLSSEDPNLCKASFSGNANMSRYNLLPGESVTVRIGEMLMDNGASSNCTDALVCDTRYVFRVFAHNVPQGLAKSDWTPILTCSTSPCNIVIGGCTYTQGYWKNHGPIPRGNNVNEWPVDNLNLGSVNYTDLQLLAIFNTPPAGGNGLIILAHQLIAAKLNIANGADGSAIAADIIAADLMIGSRICPPVGAGSLSSSSVSALATRLDNYNNGHIGPGHCD